MLSRMSDPQQPARNQHQVPPYISQQSQTGYPGQPARQPTTGNPAGRAGLIIGLIGLTVGVVTNLIVQMMIRTDGYMIISLISGVGALLGFVLALAALILGIIGLRRPDAPHGTAGIATGLGIAGVVGIALNYLFSLIGSLLNF